MLIALAIILGSLGSALSDAHAAQKPTFATGVELVRLDVVVVDSAGRPVPGLRADELEVRENGQTREIASFEPIVVAAPRSERAVVAAPDPMPVAEPQVHDPREGRCVLIFFDDVHVSPRAAQDVRSRLEPFLAREVRDGDWVTLMAPQADVWWTARTAWERQQIPAIIARLGGQLNRYPFETTISEYGAMEAIEYGSRTGAQGASRGGSESVSGGLGPPARGASAASGTQELYEVACRRIRQTLSGLRLALRSLLGFRGRKSLILYSEGFIRAPRVEAQELKTILDLARRGNVAIYFVNASGLMAEGAKWDENELQRSQNSGGTIHLALETGGRVSQSNDFTGAVKRVLDESEAYYLIGFVPASGRRAEPKVEIDVRRPGLKVLARERRVLLGVLSEPKEGAADVLALRGVSDATDVPLRVTLAWPDEAAAPHATDPRVPKTAGARTALVRIEIGLAAERPEEHFTFVAEARPRDSGEAVVDSSSFVGRGDARPLIVERRWRLTPGVWQSRVVVTHTESKRRGSVLLTFEVEPRI